MKIPVLFIVFNRKQLALKTFERIKQYKPQFLYIAADGPREDREGEDLICEEVRSEILRQITWPCCVHKLFREKNVGCGYGVSGAITWFLKNEKYGAIIEDDCSPSLDFFLYCEELLPKYEKNENVMQINGFNPLASGVNSCTYSFSRYPKIWGWATWSRAWNKFDINMDIWQEYRNSGRIWKHFPPLEAFIHRRIWDNYKKELSLSEKPRTWDFQWSISIFSNNGLCVVPGCNLVVNTGEGVEATNCDVVDPEYKKIEYGNLQWPIIHPVVVKLDKQTNKKDSDAYMARRWRLFVIKLKEKLKRK